MSLMRYLRGSTALAVVSWHLTALAMVPTAVCCCVAMATSEAAEHCVDDAQDASVVLDRAGLQDDGEACPTLRGCETEDDALLGFLLLTAQLTESGSESTKLPSAGLVIHDAERTVSLALAPPAPPPRG